MKNVDKIKDWILSNDWEYGPKTEKSKQMLKDGDTMYVYNVYMLDDKKRESLSMLMFGEKTYCRLCWRFPDLSDLQCQHRLFPLNNCRKETLKWMEMDENDVNPEEWIKKVKSSSEQ